MVIRYIFGIIWVLFIGSAVAIIISLLIVAVLSVIDPVGREFFKMIGSPASSILIITPGVVFGFFAARQSW